MDLEEQPEPETAACPACGSDPEPNPEHKLRALGYLHDDIEYTCSECGKEWAAGVPIGTADSEDMRCSACWKSDKAEVYGRANWMTWEEDTARDFFDIALKCPRCYYVWRIRRDATNKQAMMRDPTIAGEGDDAKMPFDQ